MDFGSKFKFAFKEIGLNITFFTRCFHFRSPQWFFQKWCIFVKHGFYCTFCRPREFNRRKRGVDYNIEIPFEKKPAPGFFDTAEEHENKKHFDFNRLRQNALEGETRDEVEAKERRKDRAKMKALKEDDLPAAILKTHGSVMPEKKRSKLVLPQPQVTDKELEQVGFRLHRLRIHV